MDQSEYDILLAFCCNRTYNKNERLFSEESKEFCREGRSSFFYCDKEGGEFQVI